MAGGVAPPAQAHRIRTNYKLISGSSSASPTPAEAAPSYASTGTLGLFPPTTSEPTPTQSNGSSRTLMESHVISRYFEFNGVWLPEIKPQAYGGGNPRRGRAPISRYRYGNITRAGGGRRQIAESVLESHRCKVIDPMSRNPTNQAVTKRAVLAELKVFARAAAPETRPFINPPRPPVQCWHGFPPGRLPRASANSQPANPLCERAGAYY